MVLTVRLSGNNFVSEKTQAAFEEALRDGPQVASVAKSSDGETGVPTGPMSDARANVSAPVVSSATESPAPQSLSLSPPVTRALDGLEQGLAQIHTHQQESLRVHQQYLANQAEYVKLFSQLVQQQGALFSKGHSAPSETMASVMENLTRTLARFQEHQSETLQVHEQFLQDQTNYAQDFIELLQSEYTPLIANGSKPTSQVVPASAQSSASSLPRVEGVKPSAAVADIGKATAPSRETEPLTKHEVLEESQASDTSLAEALLHIVSDKTGYPAEMLELDMDIESDLGIDSIKRVEILGAFQSLYPDLPQVNPEDLAELRTLGQIIDHVEQREQPHHVADTLPQRDMSQIGQSTGSDNGKGTMAQALLGIVSDKTGYPAEMLELDMDIESDLGIDSIKRVEILGAFQSLYPDLPQVNPEDLAELRTLGQILDHVSPQARVAVKKNV